MTKVDVTTMPWADRFELEKEIGKGGFGTVYRVRDRNDKAIYALKAINPSLDDADFERMKREIRTLMGLDSPFVVHICEIDSTSTWYTMPLAEGDLSSRAPYMDPCERCDAISAVAHALEILHSSRLIHRDVSPGNILYFPNEKNQWKLADLGLVRRFPGDTTQYITRAAIGTLPFAAPEIEIDAHKVDHTCDIFSLGQVAGWLASGHIPTAFQTTILDGGPWKDLVAKMTQKSIANRPSLQEVTTGIDRVREEIRSNNKKQWDAGLLSRGPKISMPEQRLLLYVLVEEGYTWDYYVKHSKEMGLKKEGVALSLGMLHEKGLLHQSLDYDDNHEPFHRISLTKEGEAWLADNIKESELLLDEPTKAYDDDIPF